MPLLEPALYAKDIYVTAIRALTGFRNALPSCGTSVRRYLVEPSGRSASFGVACSSIGRRLSIAIAASTEVTASVLGVHIYSASVLVSPG